MLLLEQSSYPLDLYFFSVFFGNKTAWMFGRTPPEAIVTPPKSLFNSSSFLTARVRWRGTMRLFLLSRAAFPASSKISAHRYPPTRQPCRQVLPRRHETRTCPSSKSGRYDQQGIEDQPLQTSWCSSYHHDLLFLFRTFLLCNFW